MSKIDAKGNIHGRDGRFLPKHSSESDDDIVIELPEKEPIVVNPADVIDDNFTEYPTILLPLSEYKMVMSELATNLTEEEHEQVFAVRNIRNYSYTVIVRGFGDYRIIGKKPIKSRKRSKKH